MKLALCHIFVFMDNRAAAQEALDRCGLAVNLSRVQEG